MAIRTYNKNAWEDIDDLQALTESGASETAECAKAYVDNAWEDVWKSSEFTVQATRNCLITADNGITVSFSWLPQSGDGGGFNIYGDFKAGVTYELAITCIMGAGESLLVSTGIVSHTLYVGSGSTGRVSFTPLKDYEVIGITASGGGATSGSYYARFTDVTINGNEFTYVI